MTEALNCANNCTCDKECKDHAMNANRITILEERFQIIDKNTRIVNQLAGRVNVLIVLMAITATSLTSGAVYTFTSMSEYKQMRAKDQKTITKQLYDMDQSIDKRFDSIEHRLTLIEATSKKNKKTQ